MLGLVFLLTFVASLQLIASFPDVRKLPMCDVSMFRDSKIGVMYKYGIQWVDGNQSSIDEVNRKFDESEVLRSHNWKRNYGFEFDGAKLFYLKNYTHVMMWGMMPHTTVTDQLIFRMLYVPHLEAKGYATNSAASKRFSIFLYSKEQNASELIKPTGSGSFNANSLGFRVCQERTVYFIPGESKLFFDDEELDFVYTSNMDPLGPGPNYSKPLTIKCPMATGSVERVADFNNRLEFGHHLYFEKDRLKDEQEGNFFLNQLESGNFKLHVEVANDSSGDFYYHVLTLLDSVDFLREVEGGKCVIRKYKKVDKRDAVEFPRMLIIPKTTGSGVKLLTTTTSTIAAPTTNETSTLPSTNRESTTEASVFEFDPTASTADPVESILEIEILDANSSYTNGTTVPKETSVETTIKPKAKEGDASTESPKVMPEQTNKSFFLFTGCLIFSIFGAAFSALMLFLTHRNVLFSDKKKKTKTGKAKKAQEDSSMG